MEVAMLPRWRRVFVVLVALLTLAFPAPTRAAGGEEGASGDESSLFAPEITTSTRFPLRYLESPTSVTVITGDDIRASAATNLADLLRSVAGVEVMILNASQSQVSLRGLNSFASTKMLVLIDGRQPFLDFFGVTDINLLPISLDDIKQIEIVKTPGTIYGANALSGVINIITKGAGEVRGARLSLLGGEHRTERGTFQFAGTGQKASGYLFFSGFRTGGWPPASSGASPLFNKDFKFSGKLDYRVGENGDLNLTVGGSTRDAKTFVPLAVSTFDTDTRNLNAALKYVRTPRPRQSLDFLLAFDSSESRIPSTQQTSRADVVVRKTSLEAHEYRPVGSRDLFSWGVEAEQLATDRGLTVPDPAHPLGYSQKAALSRNVNRWSAGAYAQIKHPMSVATDLYLGGSFDHHYAAGNRFSPYVSLVHQLTESSSLRLSNFTAYRAPNVFELYSDFAVLDNGVLLEFQGTPTLGFEKLNSTELSLSARLGLRTQGEITLFYNQTANRIDRVFVYNPNSSVDKLIFANVGSAALEGVELGIEHALTAHWRVNANATLQNSPDRKLLFTFPKTKMNAGLFYIGARGFSASIQADYVSKARWEVGRSGSVIQPVDAYTIANLALLYDWRPEGSVALRVFNLFNSAHEEFVTSKPDRKVTLEVTYNRP